MTLKNAISLAQLLHRMCAVELVLRDDNSDKLERVNVFEVDRMIEDAHKTRQYLKNEQIA